MLDLAIIRETARLALSGKSIVSYAVKGHPRSCFPEDLFLLHINRYHGKLQLPNAQNIVSVDDS